MRRLLVVSVFIGLAGPASGQGQPPDRTAMYEDVEVMRRLLADAYTRAKPAATWGYFHRPLLIDPVNVNTIRTGVTGAYDFAITHHPAHLRYLVGNRVDDLTFTNATDALFSLHSAAPAPPPTDGTYLKGVGPVFHLTLEAADAAGLEPPVKSAGLASNCARCHGAAMDQKVKAPPAGPKQEPPDPWDARLRQVRGEKDPPAAEPPATRLGRDEVCLPGILTEVALGTLTRYGHRFRDLPAAERLTVVVTVRPAPQPAADGANDPAAQARAQADEQVAAGDLHSKQGKPDEAVAAYRKAVEVLTRPLSFPESAPFDQVQKATEETTKALRAAHGKLAQALLAAGKLDEAKAAIEAAKGASVTIATEKSKPAPPARPPLPTKLTVSLTRKAIDDHKAGRINLFELRSAAEVEAVGFPGREARPLRP
jgi:hypothetical protein